MRSQDLESLPRRPVDGNSLPAVRPDDDVRNRRAACYHEAGHAVFAYEVGWWVNYEGIDIGQQYTGLGCREIDYTPWRRAWVHLAGLMAEYRYLGADPLPNDEDLAYVLAAARTGQPRTGDEGEVFRALIEQFPDESDRGLLERYRAYGRHVWGELTRSDRLWRCIERVAAALFRKGRLTADEVEALLSACEVPSIAEPVRSPTVAGGPGDDA